MFSSHAALAARSLPRTRVVALRQLHATPAAAKILATKKVKEVAEKPSVIRVLLRWQLLFLPGEQEGRKRPCDAIEEVERVTGKTKEITKEVLGASKEKTEEAKQKAKQTAEQAEKKDELKSEAERRL